MVNKRKKVTFIGIRVYPEDKDRWNSIIKPEKTTIFLGIRIYQSDKNRWEKIIKKLDKPAKDIFKEMLDMYLTNISHDRGKLARDVFNEMLNMYERHIIVWDSD